MNAPTTIRGFKADVRRKFLARNASARIEWTRTWRGKNAAGFPMLTGDFTATSADGTSENFLAILSHSNDHGTAVLDVMAVA